MFKNENIWIIGASSGIGHALATTLHQQGAKLILSARRTEKLQELNQQLGGNHIVAPLDVSQHDQIHNVVQSFHMHIHRVIFLSATYNPTFAKEASIELINKIVDINLKGALYLVKEILPIFENQQHGQIAICASVAGYTGLPQGQPYSATKAALINYAESLYAELPSYIDIKLINPGFVKTRITDKNTFHMPLIINPDKAAQYITKGLKKNAFEIHFPKNFTWPLKFFRILPYKIKLFITPRLLK